MIRKDIFFISILITITLCFSTGWAQETPSSIDNLMKDAIAELGSEGSSDELVTTALMSDSKKSGKRAMFLSLLVPGLGEYYLGDHAGAKIFMGAEAMTWASYGGFKKLVDWRREDVDVYTYQHAGINIEGKDEEFLQILKRYPRSENQPNLSGSYNEGVRRDARYYYPYSPAEQEVYEQENYLIGDDAFIWDTPDNWVQYKVLLHKYRDADKKAFYMTGVAVVNRLVSAIHSVWLTRRMNKGIDNQKVNLDFQTDVVNQEAMVVLNIMY